MLCSDFKIDESVELYKSVLNFDGKVRLQELSKIHNEITQKQFISNNALVLASKNLTCMPEIDTNVECCILNDNKIENLTNSKDMCKLKRLSISRNILNSSNNGFVSLTHLNISYNNLTSITGLQNLNRLIFLDASHNMIHMNIHLSLNENLQFLNLSFNKIELPPDLSFSRNLNTILLNNNKISSLSKVPLTFPTSSLKNLTLSGNFIPKLSELTFLSCLVNLKELTLFDNPIYFTESIYRINGFVHNFCKNIKVFDYMNIKNPPPSKIFNESTHSKFLNSRNRLNQTEIVENVCVSDVIDGEIESIESVSMKPKLNYQNRQSLPHILPRKLNQLILNKDFGKNKDMNKKAADDFKSIANSSMLDSNSVYLPVNGIENLTDTKVAKKANLTFSLKRKPVKIDKINKIAWDNFNYTDKQHGAAKIIQAAWRGYFTRKQNGQVLKFRNYQKQKRIFDYINYLCSAIKKYTDLYNRERKMRILQTHAIKKLWTQVAKLKLWRQQVDESKKNCSDGAIPIDTQSDFSCSKTMDSDLLKNSQTITNLNDNHKFLEIKVSELEKKFFKLEQLHNVKLNFTDHDGTDKNYIKCIELKIQEYGFLDNYIILSWTKEPSQDSFSQFIIYVNKVKHTTLPSSQCCAIVYINDEDYYTFSVSLFVDNVEVNNSNLVNFKKSHVLNQGLNTLDAENTSSDVMSLGYNQPIVLSESESSVNSRETKMKQKSLSNVSIREFNSSSVSDTAIYRINSKPKIDRLRTHSERCIESLQPISCTRKPTLLFKKQSTLKNKHKMETRNPISKSPRYIDFKRKFTREIKF